MIVPFGETELEEIDDGVQLIDGSGNVILKLSKAELEEAIWDGYLNAGSLHTSVYEHARIAAETRSGTVIGGDGPDESERDRDFLSGLGIRWD